MRAALLLAGLVVPGLAVPGLAFAADRVIASVQGSFAGAAGLSLEADADRVAALEQQSFREFRWDVVEPATLGLSFTPQDGAAAAAQLMVSLDGERFQPLAGDVLPGQVVSVLVTQTMQEAEGSVTFPASSWGFDLVLPVQVTPEAGDSAATFGAVLVPVAFGKNLGCATEGCGEETTGAAAALPDVDGDPDSEPGTATAAAAPAPSDADTELARELQTELARIGCYTIAVDGLWGPGSRRAMDAYNAASGAALPVQGPTPKALVAVARETETVCAE